MKTILSRSTLTLAICLTLLGVAVQADELRYSEFESRLAKIEAELDTNDEVRQVAYAEVTSANAYYGEASGPNLGGNRLDGSGFYAELQIGFLRTHLLELPGKKLSEEYEFSPRLIVGRDNGHGQGKRLRYWHYGHNLNNIADPSDGGIRTEMDVVDLEHTQRFHGPRSDLTVSGGGRIGHFEFFEESATPDTEDLVGFTVAADVETLLTSDCCSRWTWVYGGRLSVLGADLKRLGNPVGRDDNWVVTELYSGAQYGYNYYGRDVFGRVAFEMQNWHLDSFNVDSLQFVGPSVHMGINY